MNCTSAEGCSFLREAMALQEGGGGSGRRDSMVSFEGRSGKLGSGRNISKRV